MKSRIGTHQIHRGMPQAIPGESSSPGGMEPVRVILEVSHPGGINRRKLSILSEYFKKYYVG